MERTKQKCNCKKITKFPLPGCHLCSEFVLLDKENSEFDDDLFEDEDDWFDDLDDPLENDDQVIVGEK